jgi:hypothetical protein
MENKADTANNLREVFDKLKIVRENKLTKKASRISGSLFC